MSSSRIVRRTLTVELENGLHIVPCSAIARTVKDFPGAVRIIHGTVTADATSVFDLLGLNAQCGTTLTVEADGDGAGEILDRLTALFQSGFSVQP